MFAYTCPKCKQRYGTDNLRSGAVQQCLKCKQRMRVVLAKEPANAGVIRQAQGRNYGPHLLGVSALAGILIGGGIFFLSSFFRNKPAPFVPQLEAMAQNDAPQANDRPKREDQAKSGAEPKGEAPAKADDGRPVKAAAKPEGVLKADAAAMAGDVLYSEILKSCVWIVATDGRKVWTGSGSLIDREELLVLTNQHVANRSCSKIWVFFPIDRNGKLVTERESYLADFKKEKPANAFTADLVYDQAICDLALIRLKGLPKGKRALRLSRGKVKPGQTLHTVGGNPEGNTGVWIYSSGAVRQISVEKWHYKDGVNREAEVIRSDVSMNHGDSGGGLVDDRGLLVGVNVMAAEGVLNAGHIHVNEVRRFLQTAYRQQLDKQFKEPEDEPQRAGPVLAERIAAQIKGLQAPLAENRKEAAVALGKIGADAQKAAMPLLKIVRTPAEASAVRRAAAEALKEIGAPSPEYFKALLSALADKNCNDARRYAALSLGSLPEEKRKEAIEALKNALKDNDPQVRQNAATSLGSYGKLVYEEANMELVECLRDNEGGVREAAYQALRTGGVPEEVDLSSVRDLLEGVKDGKKPTPQARYWAIFLLVHKFREKGLPYIVASLEEEENFEDLRFMIFVLSEIRKFKFNSLDVGAILSKALDHREEVVCFEAIEVFKALNGKTFGDFVKPEENTVEALIKICVRYPKLAVWLEEKTEKEGGKEKTTKESEKVRFKNHIRDICSTFFKLEGLAFQSSPKLVEILSKALGESDDLARRVAVNCLERSGKDAAKAAPALAEALLKEKEADIRVEILAALAALAEAGKAELESSKENSLREELDKWIGDARNDNHEVQALASLVMASFYPGQPYCNKAYRVLAKALLLKNADFKVDPIQLARFLRMRIGPNARPKPNERERELHQRAKQALSRGGVLAGDAVCDAFKNGFISQGVEKVDVVLDKFHARLSAFQVLTKIGAPLKTSKARAKVNWVIQWDLTRDMEGREESRIADAAREARREIFGK